MTQTTDIPRIELNSGTAIPQLGLGVFQVPPEATQEIVEEAFAVGYRHIDTAKAYRNEEGVGGAIAASGIPREEIFVTTKLWNDDQGHDAAVAGFEASLERLGVDYVDLYLIHWPAPAKDLFVETWRAFEEIRADGRAAAIGVSNFRIEDLERLAEETNTVPAVNQIELHPTLQQSELRDYHDERGIRTEAWSPIAQGELLRDETIGAISGAHDRTAAQVILRWHIQLGNIVFPKSSNPDRIRENFELFDFELSEDEMRSMESLDTGRRT